MILDKKLVLTGAGQSPTAIGATPTTDVIDFGSTRTTGFGVDAGGSGRMMLRIAVSAAVDSTTDTATVAFDMQDSADAVTYATVSGTGAKAQSVLVKGKEFYLPLPPGLRRYVRGLFTIAGEVLTAGQFQMQIVDGHDNHPAMPDGL